MRRATALLMSAALLAGAACSDDDPTGPDDAELFVGTFVATSMIFTPDGGGSPIDVIPFGASLTVTIDAQGDFSWTLTPPGQPAENEVGTLDVDASAHTVTVDFQDPEADDIFADYSFSADGEVLTLQADDVQFDLNQDGVDDPASVQVIMERQ